MASVLEALHHHEECRREQHRETEASIAKNAQAVPSNHPALWPKFRSTFVEQLDQLLGIAVQL
jgi:hypothetical protein